MTVCVHENVIVYVLKSVWIHACLWLCECVCACKCLCVYIWVNTCMGLCVWALVQHILFTWKQMCVLVPAPRRHPLLPWGLIFSSWNLDVLFWAKRRDQFWFPLQRPKCLWVLSLVCSLRHLSPVNLREKLKRAILETKLKFSYTSIHQDIRYFTRILNYHHFMHVYSIHL